MHADATRKPGGLQRQCSGINIPLRSFTNNQATMAPWLGELVWSDTATTPGNCQDYESIPGLAISTIVFDFFWET